MTLPCRARAPTAYTTYSKCVDAKQCCRGPAPMEEDVPPGPAQLEVPPSDVVTLHGHESEVYMISWSPTELALASGWVGAHCRRLRSCGTGCVGVWARRRQLRSSWPSLCGWVGTLQAAVPFMALAVWVCRRVVGSCAVPDLGCVGRWASCRRPCRSWPWLCGCAGAL